MILTSNLPLLTSANWYQWEQLALNSISVYGHAGRAIQTNQPYTAVEQCKPMRIFYLEEVENADMDIIVQQSSRLWNDATDWPLYNKTKEEYYVSQQRYQHDKQALWSYLLTHIDSDVDHLIKLHPDYAEAAENWDTNKLWIILRQSVNQHGTFNASEIKIEWANYKQSTFDTQGNILSTIPLAKYLFRFQNYVDNFRGHLLKPTDLECTETLLAGINPRRYSYVWHKYYGSTSPKPTYSHLKAELLQSDKNQISISEEPLVNVTTVTPLPQETNLPLSLVSNT